MIGYATFGTNDLPRSCAFYDALCAELGAKRVLEFERGVAWGTSMAEPSLCVLTPFDGSNASVGNGVMVALVVKDRAQVAQTHAKALSLGAQDEGLPGDRGGGFYCAYFRDLDGNKLNVFCMG